MSTERTNEVCTIGKAKADYSAPRILWTERLTARATECMRGDSSCAPGPIQS